MEERNESIDKFDEELPGFRFHPTDEELVGFYLTRKIQQKPLSIQLIKQIDIYKYDPWDLPKLATNSGEKEWYFYCPRDRKYRNSTRPNRVTGAGFWKATGTDRPIYSSESSKCIGLKKSLVFYRGKAAKGIKTDWMMHEFRLPSLSPSPPSSTHKNIPINEAWAICRIFKKANSQTKRNLSHNWVNPVFDTNKSDIMNPNSSLQFGFCNDLEQPSFSSFSPPYFPPNEDQFIKNSYTSSSIEKASTPASRNVVNDATSLLLDMSTSILGDFGANMELSASYNGFFEATNESMQKNLGYREEEVSVKGENVGEIVDEKWMEFPYGFPSNSSMNFMWDSSPCPSDFSTSFSTNKCYT